MKYTTSQLEHISNLVRYWILYSTTQAGSGHPSSSLSSVELGVGLFFGGGFHYNINNSKDINNDRFILSKGHASPLLYSLWLLAGVITPEEIQGLRQFTSVLEGHPSRRFIFTDAATGSLGQGLGIGIGYALNAKKFDKVNSYTYVLLGDSELAEGSIWEGAASASYYGLNNLVAIVDINRLGQRGETMEGYKIEVYQKRFEAFGWNTIIIDGHNLEEVINSINQAKNSDKPTVILAKTIKGKGISLIEDKDNWHGKALTQEQFDVYIEELGHLDLGLRAEIESPIQLTPYNYIPPRLEDSTYPNYSLEELVSPRKAFGEAIKILTSNYNDIIVLDAEVSNSTYSNHIDASRFVEMFIAEQNMLSVATGLSLAGKKPFVTSFAGFLTRAYDQIRMAQYNEVNMVVVGTHPGVSIGADGPSQMALNDIAFFRGMFGSIVLYPSDAVSALKLTEQAYLYEGMSYLRLTRADLPVIYSNNESFVIGGSKTIYSSELDEITLVGAGITVYECLKTYDILIERGVRVRVIDLYSIKPLDTATLHLAARETKGLIVVEDHSQSGGIAEAVRSELEDVSIPIRSLSVQEIPRSGTPEELLQFEQINVDSVIEQVETLRQSI
jgi:transketolase